MSCFCSFLPANLAQPAPNYWDILDELKIQMNYSYETHTITGYEVTQSPNVQKLDNQTIELSGYLYPNGDSYMLLKYPYRGGCDGIVGHYVLLKIPANDYAKLTKHQAYTWQGKLKIQPESKAPFIFVLENPVQISKDK